MPIRTLIVDNQPVVRRGLTMFLQTDSEIDIAGEATNGREAVQIANRLQPDVILMDLMMPEMDGAAATRAIRVHQPNLAIIALSTCTDYTLITAAVLAGVSSYLHKGIQPNLLLATIKGVVAGRVMIAPPMINRILPELPPPTNVQLLNPDQIALLLLLAAGYSDSEIAERRQMDSAAVQLAVQDIQVRLACNSRLLAMLRAIQLGLIERPPAS